MTDPYLIATHEARRGAVPEAKQKTKGKIVGSLGRLERAFIAQAPMIFVSTAGSDGRVTVSPKGDAPGFVTVADDRTLLSVRDGPLRP
jgi:uncharacterized protein